MALDVHVVSHTHWDREWYHTFERFRQRLIALVDELLDEPPDSSASFLLDGQAILVDDYGAVRPDRAAELAALIRQRRLEAGPWYVLADELIPSGEALVRNLLTGRRTLARIGASSPPALVPSRFVRPSSSAPRSRRWFRTSADLLWRGYGGARWPSGDTVRWAGLGGDTVVLYHLPRDGYEYGSHLPIDDAAAEGRWSQMRRELVPRSTTGVILVPNGADHHARQLRLSDALSALERAGAADRVHRSSLRQFADQLVERSAAEQLPVVRGELRDSYGYTWTLQGTFATRAHEKRLNARAERALVRETEPWAALAAKGRRSRRPLVEAAWRDLLTAHPHDTLCGCSIDGVASAMEGRLRSVIVQAHGIRDDAVQDLIRHDPVVARVSADHWRPIVVVRNAAPRSRSGVALIDVEEFVAHIAVGPGSAAGANPDVAVPRAKPKIPALGARQVLSEELRNARTESPRHYPDNDIVVVRRVAAWVSDAPAYGVATFPIGTDSVAPCAPRSVSRRPVSLRNAHLHVPSTTRGRCRIEHSRVGRRISDAISLLDETRHRRSVHAGAACARLRSSSFVACVACTAGHFAASSRRDIASRWLSRRGADVDVSLAPHARCRGAVPSRRGRRRESARRITAFASRFGATSRTRTCGRTLHSHRFAVSRWPSARRKPPSSTLRQRRRLHRYVSLFNERPASRSSATGWPSTRRADAEVLVTLLRAVGELSRNDLPERPGHAGWPTPTPGAQCLGPFEASFGRDAPRSANHRDRRRDRAHRRRRAAPARRDDVRSALEPLTVGPGRELVGEGLAFSAMKESEDGDWIVLRCVNRSNDTGPVRGACRSWRAKRASLASMKRSSSRFSRRAPKCCSTRHRARSRRSWCADYARSRSVPPASPARRSRSVSPKSVHASTVAMSARPGAIATHGAATIRSRPPAIMFPQLGLGGCMPMPRNDRPLSSRIALPTPSVVATMAGPSEFGSA